jgi:hypothetical protein
VADYGTKDEDTAETLTSSGKKKHYTSAKVGPLRRSTELYGAADQKNIQSFMPISVFCQSGEDWHSADPNKSNYLFVGVPLV